MSEEKKYPKVIVGVFIFNEAGEVLLIRAPRWQNKYSCIGRKVEMAESITEALIREIKEETNLDVNDIKLINVVDGMDLNGTNNYGYEHLIFLDHTAVCNNQNEIKLNEEGEEYEWLHVDKWLEKDEKEFAPYVYDQLKKLKETKAEDSIEHRYKRALADYQNLLKQTAKEKEEFTKYANEQLLYQILPIYDNLKMVIAHSDRQEHDSWHEGVVHVLKQFKNTLSEFGVEEVKTVGEKFDHNTMEAVSSEPTKDHGRDDMVAKEIKAGYRLNGKIIMPAKVVVYKLKI